MRGNGELAVPRRMGAVQCALRPAGVRRLRLCQAAHIHKCHMPSMHTPTSSKSARMLMCACASTMGIFTRVHTRTHKCENILIPVNAACVRAHAHNDTHTRAHTHVRDGTNRPGIGPILFNWTSTMNTPRDNFNFYQVGCNNEQCPAGEYRSGTCSGRTNQYRCNSKTKCATYGLYDKRDSYNSKPAVATNGGVAKTYTRNTDTQNSLCTECPSGKFGTKNAGCSGATCFFGEEKMCKTCSSANCPGGQYRSGTCGGRSNGYKCNTCCVEKTGEHA